MKYSKQRQAVLETLQQNAVHPTADELYALLHQTYPNISLATVYRNLNQLAELNIIRKIDGLKDASRFDHNLCNHYHFICSQCHKVYDVPYDIAPDLASKVSSQTGLKVESCDIVLNGICPECLKIQTSNKN